jgi:hypothetical protein
LFVLKKKKKVYTTKAISFGWGLGEWGGKQYSVPSIGEYYYI